MATDRDTEKAARHIVGKQALRFWTGSYRRPLTS
jgi:hypothetical protein